MTEDILLEVASKTDYHRALRRWADLLVKLSLTSQYGVYAKAQPVAGMGIYLSRLDVSSTCGEC